MPICSGIRCRFHRNTAGSFLAEKGKGAAYDPQESRIFFPHRIPLRNKTSRPPEIKTNEIGLEFMLPYSSVTADTGAMLLAIFRKHCPEAMPTRFGDFEPLQNRLKQGFDEPFLEFWKKTTKVEYGSSFFWKATPPCFGGSIFFSDWRDTPPNVPEIYARRHHLTISFDGIAADSDEEWRKTVIELFRALAGELKAFYAVCYVRRNIIVSRNSVMFNLNETENLRITHGPWWRGLPTVPTWLTWFGAGYAELLAPHLQGCEFVQESSPSGVFIKMGSDAMNRDQLKDIFPSLPESLLILKNGHADLIPKVDGI
jgi:hypothetical protein